MVHNKYRKDIDGLRGVAILSVVAYHAFPTLMPGGFVGVDIFFVISGYLISSIIFANLNKDSFNYFEFYHRRINRIYPALLLVMLFCFLMGWKVLFANEYKQLAKQIAAGASFISNILFFNQTGYFDNAAELKPLLHLWSLAIEEQFYIIWPFILTLLWHKKKFLFLWLLFFLVVSFFSNIYLSFYHAEAAFFLPFSRFWELLSGSLLAYFQLFRPSQYNGFENAKSFAGFLLIGLGFWLTDRNSIFPGYIVLFPVVGAYLIIWAGSHALLNKWLLSNFFMVQVGLISYPLYLWHWPILSYAHIIHIEPSNQIILGAILLSFVLAYLTMRFVEQKLRWSTNKFMPLKLLLLSVCLLLAALMITLTQGLVNRDINKSFVNSDRKLYQSSRSSDDSCRNIIKHQPVNEEVCLTNSEQPTLMIIGDSHAMALYSAIHQKKINIPAILMGGHSCYLYPNIDASQSHRKKFANNCRGIANDVLAVIKETPSIKTVIINNKALHGMTTFRFSLDGAQITEIDAFIEGTQAMIDQLSALNVEVVVLVDTPELPLTPEQCERKAIFENQHNVCQLDRSRLDYQRTDYHNAVGHLKAIRNSIRIINGEDFFCTKDTCFEKGEAGYFYFDRDHLNILGSEKALNALLNVLAIHR